MHNVPRCSGTVFTVTSDPDPQGDFNVEPSHILRGRGIVSDVLHRSRSRSDAGSRVREQHEWGGAVHDGSRKLH